MRITLEPDGKVEVQLYPEHCTYRLTVDESLTLRDGLDAILPRPDAVFCNRCHTIPATQEPLCTGCREGALTEMLREDIAEMDGKLLYPE